MLDNSGWQYLVELTTVHSSETTGRVLDSTISNGEPRAQITLYQALLKAQKFELAIQKSVELGVSRIVPVSCDRSVVAVRGPDKEHAKVERWRRIIRESSEQSERGILPDLEPPCSFNNACNSVSGPALILWEHETERGLERGLHELRERHGDLDRLSLFVGPEGGYTQTEAAHAAASNILPVTLGPRVLRAETAGMAAIAAVMFHLDELSF